MPIYEYKCSNNKCSTEIFEIIQSNSEARRLIRSGAVKFNGKLITNELEKISKKNIKNDKIEISIGKKKHFTIKVI